MATEPAVRNEATIAAYFAAMRRGAAAEEDMLALFTDDAEYVEPFSGRDEPAVGRDQIRDRLRAGWEAPLPDLELDVRSIDVTGDEAVSRWECRSPALPGGVVTGTDTYEFRHGRIQRLVVRLDPPNGIDPQGGA